MSDEQFESVQLEVLPQIDSVTHTPSIAKLSEALAKAQLKFEPVIKANENEAFRRGQKVSKYADLATYIDATQKALAEEGLVVMAWPDVSPEAKSMSLLTILSHSSGEWIKGRLTLPATGRDGFTAQTCGSSITYARRYVYAAIVGVASEDDDGNAASGRGTAEAAQAIARKGLEKSAQSDDPKIRKIAEAGLAKLDEQNQVNGRIVFIKHPEEANGHYFAVAGYVVEEPIQKFFADTDSKRFKSKLDGSPYWRVPQEYEQSFKDLCGKMEIEIQ